MVIKGKITQCLTVVIICSLQIAGAYGQQQKIKYEMAEKGYSIHIRNGWNNEIKMPRMSHFSNVSNVIYDSEFNRGIKRGNTILVTGDEPRFALMKYLIQDRLDPDLLKLGDGRFCITIDGKKHWLHHEKNMAVTYKAGSAEYISNSFSDVTVKLVVCLAGDWGAVAKLSFENRSAKAVQIDAGLLFGGVRRCGRTATASYFHESEVENLQENILDKNGLLPSISSRFFPDKIFIRQFPEGSVTIDSLKFLFTNTFSVQPKGYANIYFVLGIASGFQEEAGILKKMSSVEPELIINETADYYTSLLDKYDIKTPSKILNAGFKTAVLNLDYVHADSAWLEGVHWWGSYWTNNYQISAATSLGEFENAKKALAFFNTMQYGPTPALTSSGKPFVDSLRQGPEDGLPYYIYQLIQYYQATGDSDFLRHILPTLAHSIDNLFQLRDPDNNGLLNWHLGANAFMYQADHLGMPGDAASPSLMMAGMLEHLSALARVSGDILLAAKWDSLSKKMYASIKKLLWNSREGFFYNHIDLQGKLHPPLYYTDLVFPGLYTTLSDSYSWQTLRYLQDRFFTSDFQGKRNLMRAGILKPSIFGNDNVMPAQMCEAARAFFRQGLNTVGASLIESVARAATVFTEAPGNFPERLNDEGKGEANYLFGNPTGSFIHSVINGLFGISLKDGGQTLSWQPAFPQTWGDASLKLPYENVSFKKMKNKDEIKLHYTANHNQKRYLKFSLLVEPFKTLSIKCNGKSVQYTTAPQLECVKLSFEADVAASHNISIFYEPVAIKMKNAITTFENSALSWFCGSEIQEVFDPQQVLTDVKIFKTKIDGVVHAQPGLHEFFVRLKEIPVFIPVSVMVKPRFKLEFPQALYNLNSKRLIIKMKGELQPTSNEMILKVRVAEKEIDFTLDKSQFDKTIIVENVELMPEGIYNIDVTLLLKDCSVYKNQQRIEIKGADSVTQNEMSNLRKQRIRHIDISELLNTQSIYAFTFWRNANVVIDSSYFNLDSIGKKKIAEYDVKRTGKNMAMVNYGISDQFTRETRSTGMPATLTVPVNMYGQALSLLFISEMETRLTESNIGVINLHFESGSDVQIPLIVGKNIDAMGGFFATDITPVIMKGWDFCKIYDIPLPVNTKLRSFTISLSSADAEFGLLAANIIAAK